MKYLADVACERPTPVPEPVDTGIPPSTLLMNIFRYIGDAAAPHPITRHGIDDLMDIVFGDPAFQATLDHATDIQEHFAVTFLRHTSPVFQDHWTYVILPAWKHHVDVMRICQ